MWYHHKETTCKHTAQERVLWPSSHPLNVTMHFEHSSKIMHEIIRYLLSAISTLKWPREVLWERWVVFQTHLLCWISICHQFGCLAYPFDVAMHFKHSFKIRHQLIRSTYFQPSVLWNGPELWYGWGGHQKLWSMSCFERFIVGASWASTIIAKGICTLTPSNDDDVVDKLDLDANDIDMYHGSFIQDTSK